MIIKPDDMPKTKQEFKDLVGQHSFRVEFTKNDKTERILNATLNFKLIPKRDWPKGLKVLPKHQVAVFDLENKQWRSFKIQTLEKLEIFRKIVASDFALPYTKKPLPNRKEKNNIKKYIYYFEKFENKLEECYNLLLENKEL